MSGLRIARIGAGGEQLGLVLSVAGLVVAELGGDAVLLVAFEREQIDRDVARPRLGQALHEHFLAAGIGRNRIVVGRLAAVVGPIADDGRDLERAEDAGERRLIRACAAAGSQAAERDQELRISRIVALDLQKSRFNADGVGGEVHLDIDELADGERRGERAGVENREPWRVISGAGGVGSVGIVDDAECVGCQIHRLGAAVGNADRLGLARPAATAAAGCDVAEDELCLVGHDARARWDGRSSVMRRRVGSVSEYSAT